jgi:VanZ family protein
MRKLARTAAPFLPALLLMGLIFAASGMPSDDTDKGLLVLITRKLAHFGEYFLLMALWWWALQTQIDARKALLPALLIAVGYAISDEFHQSFVDGRVGTWRDVVIDSAGALTATWLIARYRLRERAAANA